MSDPLGARPFSPINIKNAIELCEDFMEAGAVYRESRGWSPMGSIDATNANLQYKIAKGVLEQYLRSLQN